MNRVMSQIKEKIVDPAQAWMRRRKSGSGGGLGEPGTTQQPGRRSGGPAEGPMTGGSSGPAGAS